MSAVSTSSARRRRDRDRRGVASLVMLLLLLGAALLAGAWTQRNVLSEARIAANQQRNASALEAAEAGLAWAQALLNDGAAIGTDCRAAAAGTGASFRQQFVQAPDPTGRFAPRRQAGAAPQLACSRDDARWTCSCEPNAGAAGDATVERPTFAVELLPGVHPATLVVAATGCNRAARPCLPQAVERAEASSRLQLTLALLPALPTPPAAALTALGDIDFGGAAAGLHNADAASGGLAGHAGGRIVDAALRISTTPGGAAAAALLGGDATLAATPPAQLFARHFGSEIRHWMQQPGVRRLACAGDCAAPLQALIAEDAEPARIGVAGDLRLDGSLQLGSIERPVMLVVDGDLQLGGPVRIHGLVFAHNLRWDAAAGGAGLLRGAAVVAGSVGGDGPADIVYDRLLMARLQRQLGTWVRVPGSWRDSHGPG